ncbi:MAG: hypothetical protein ACTSWC_10250 [Promethearchaeota archaeon]
MEDEIKAMERYINEIFSHLNMEQISKTYVPEENDRRKIAEIANHLTASLKWNDYIEDCKKRSRLLKVSNTTIKKKKIPYEW